MYFKYDFHMGIMSRWKRFIVPFLIGAFHGFDVYTSFRNTRMSFGNMIFGLFGGIPGIAGHISEIEIIDLPVNWILFNLCIIFVTGGYPSDNLKRYGKNMIVAGKSRKRWVAGKYAWGAAAVLISYLMLYIGMAAVSLASGTEADLHITKAFRESLSFSLSVTPSVSDMQIYGILMPFLSSVTEVIMYITVMITVGQAYSFVIMFAYILLSLFINTPLLAGNSSMILRNSIKFSDEGNSAAVCLLCMAATVVISAAAGMKYFEKKDIL